MNERLLHFIWKNRYFNQLNLHSTNGEKIKIVDTGIHNSDQGPDFLMGKIFIDDKLWYGQIELHVNASDWHNHGHDYDRNYDNVILHVVWNNDRSDSVIPTLELFNLVPSLLLDRYSEWMKNLITIPCYNELKNQKLILNRDWLDNLLVDRISKKAIRNLNNIIRQRNDWEEIFWQQLAKAFGYRVNALAFELIAITIPWKIILKHRNSIHQLEALLMGQANLLHPGLKDHYSVMLFKEYQFLTKKYNLKSIWLPIYFLRMRPRNFPTVRLAQLSAFIAENGHVFPKLIQLQEINSLKRMLNVKANDYWNDHFRFDIISPYDEKRLGIQMINNIIVNVFMPFIYAYHELHGDFKKQIEKLDWLKKLAPEKNLKIKCFDKIGIYPLSSWESQALLELKTEFCDKQNCLDCFWGKQMLGRVNTFIKAS